LALLRSSARVIRRWGEFNDAKVIRKLGYVPDDLSGL
jgi:hypothetical protein